MPIEIRELVIKAEVGPGNRNTQSQDSASPGLSEKQLQEIVDRVVEVLKNKKKDNHVKQWTLRKNAADCLSR